MGGRAGEQTFTAGPARLDGAALLGVLFTSAGSVLPAGTGSSLRNCAHSSTQRSPEPVLKQIIRDFVAVERIALNEPDGNGGRSNEFFDFRRSCYPTPPAPGTSSQRLAREEAVDVINRSKKLCLR